MNKLCTKCNETKNISQFAKNRKRPDGLQTYCSSCKKEFDGNYYKKNTQHVIDRNLANKRKNLEWLEQYKTTLKCQCGESHPACLDFHHRDRNTKIDQIANLVQRWSTSRLKTEIAKCDVLCANCHRKLHYEERHGP